MHAYLVDETQDLVISAIRGAIRSLKAGVAAE
jgi:hypothetical protein